MPSLEGLLPHLESGCCRDRGQGRGDSPESTCPSRGFGEPSGSGPPGLHAAAPLGGAHASHTRCVEEQAGPSEPLFSPGVNPEPSQDQEVRHQQRTHPLQPQPPQSCRERHWRQHRTSGPAGVGRPPHRPTVSLRPDEPPVSTALCLLRRSGRRAPGRSSREAGRWGSQREGRSFHAQRWSASSEQSDSLPAGSTSPQRPLPSTSEGSCLDFPGEEQTEGGPTIAKPAAQGRGGWPEGPGSEGTRGSR